MPGKQFNYTHTKTNIMEKIIEVDGRKLTHLVKSKANLGLFISESGKKGKSKWTAFYNPFGEGLIKMFATGKEATEWLLNPTQPGQIVLTREEAVKHMRKGAEIMVTGYDNDFVNFTGITIDDFEGETDEQIIISLADYPKIQFWPYYEISPPAKPLGPMKTKLPAHIQTVEQAKELLRQLYRNNETFHPEDDCNTIVWDTVQPTKEECELLNKLMADIYNLPGNEDTNNMAFDPCGFFLQLDMPYFLVRDHSGRGEPPLKINGWDILERWGTEALSELDDNNEQQLEDFIRESDLGNTWRRKTESFENIGK